MRLLKIVVNLSIGQKQYPGPADGLRDIHLGNSRLLRKQCVAICLFPMCLFFLS